MKVLTRKDASISDIRSLNGAGVALSKGTTSEKLFLQLREKEIQTMALQTFPSNVEALKALTEDKVSAFPQDDVLLSGVISTLPDRDRYILAGEYLSIEPYAIMVRKEDKALLALVDATLASLYGSGEIHRIYDRWFNTSQLQVPISRLTREAFTRPSRDSGFAKVLGYTL